MLSVKNAERSRMLMTRNSGFTLLEVLIAIIIFAFGLLGLTGLELRLQTAQVESAQRSQAVLITRSITELVQANPFNAANYVTGVANPVGVGDAFGNDCTAAADEVTRDMCEWSQLLKGAAEQRGEALVGGMVGARGCIEQLQAADPTPGVCQPGIFRISTVWQGMRETNAPEQGLACASNLYGSETLRRVHSTTVTVGLNRCT